MATNRKLAVFVACIAALYQFWIKEFVFTVLGVGRAVEPIENFPFSCRRIVHKQLEACEDLWLDESGRVLYAACSGSIARSQWNQGMSKLNISGRRPEGSELMALYIDEPNKEGFRMHKISPKGYAGATGDGTLDLIGFDAEHVDPSTISIWLINQRPSVDESGNYLDAQKTGDNVTVDVFKHVKGENYMHHVKTVASPEVYSANGLALIGDDAFMLTNDHSAKVGLRKEFDLILGGGNVVHCNKAGHCKPVTHNKLKFANGLVRGKDNRIYVPFAALPYIGVYEQNASGALEEIDRIVLGMPVDNLSVDSNGDIWAGGLTKVLEVMEAVNNPLDALSTSTIWKIKKYAEGKYETEKALEDGEKKVVSGASTAVFDTKTGRLFIGGVSTPFMVVCDPKQT